MPWAWRECTLGGYRYIVLDAQYEKVRQSGQVLPPAAKSRPVRAEYGDESARCC